MTSSSWPQVAETSESSTKVCDTIVFSVAYLVNVVRWSVQLLRSTNTKSASAAGGNSKRPDGGSRRNRMRTCENFGFIRLPQDYHGVLALLAGHHGLQFDF